MHVCQDQIFYQEGIFMNKRKPVKKLIGIVFFILVFVFACTVFFGDLYLTPLNAAKKNNYIHKNAVLLKEISARENKIYIFQDNDQSYKTVISKPFGPFWKSEIAFNYQSNLKNDIETVGYAKINDQTINMLMLAFKTNTNDIKYVEAGPDGERFLRPMHLGNIEIFYWEGKFNERDINPIALSADKKPKYYYGFSKDEQYDDLRTIQWHEYH